MCVQNFDDSRGSAIRITYRISLRSSSLWDPRHPLLKVVMNFTTKRARESPRGSLVQFTVQFSIGRSRSRFTGRSSWFCFVMIMLRGVKRVPVTQCVGNRVHATSSRGRRFGWCDNDPSAGSPTETLLRLHLPLNDKVQTSSHGQAPMKDPDRNPESSPDHSIGRCDGRCVQRAGT